MSQALDEVEPPPEYTPAEVESAALLESLEEQEQHQLEQLKQDTIALDVKIKEDETTTV